MDEAQIDQEIRRIFDTCFIADLAPQYDSDELEYAILCCISRAIKTVPDLRSLVAVLERKLAHWGPEVTGPFDTNEIAWIWGWGDEEDARTLEMLRQVVMKIVEAVRASEEFRNQPIKPPSAP